MLVVGRMGLKAHAGVVGDGGQQAGVAGQRQVVHMHRREFHAGLHDQPADLADVGECRHVGVERGARGGGRGGRDVAVVIGAGTAGGRHLGAHHIQQAGVQRRTGAGQRGGAGHRHRVGQLRGFARAAFGAVEVDLGEARLHIVGHHDLRLGHRLIGGQLAPGLRPQMIAAEHDPGAVAARSPPPDPGQSR